MAPATRIDNAGLLTAPVIGANQSVGDVSDVLSIPVSTLRSWDRRYSVGPTGRGSGSHRRYCERDVEDVRRFAALLRCAVAGPVAGRAVQLARATNDNFGPTLIRRRVGEPSRDSLTRLLTAPLIAVASPALVGAAMALEYQTLTALVNSLLRMATLDHIWVGMVVPALQDIGTLWRCGLAGVEGEHLLCEVLSSALRARTLIERAARHPRPPGVILASVDDHHLPLLALELNLTKSGAGCIELGPRVPPATFSQLYDRVEVRRIFVWASIVPSDPDALAHLLTGQTERHLLVLGGPGWANISIPSSATEQVVRVDSLAAATQALLD